MNVVDGEIQALIRSEADHVRPPERAKERGWARLMAAIPGGEGGPGDEGGPGGASPSVRIVPAPKVVPSLKAVPLVKAGPLIALLVVGALVTWGAGRQPAIVADTIEAAVEPAVLHDAPISVPFASEPVVSVPMVAPAVPAPIEVPAPARPVAAKPRPVSDEDSFAGELSLLAAGQAAIQSGDLRKGIALLRSHKQRFPRGQFAQERDALIAIARCEGDQAGARAAGQKFMQTNPDSIHADRVRTACDL
jgi:hypothetical protein